MKRIFVLFAFLCSFLGYSQIVTAPTLYATEDGHTNSASTGTNYGTLGTMNVSVASGPAIYRGFLKFNLTSIPSNAVITSALVRLTPSGTENVTASSTQIFLDVCNSSWTETGISHSSNISNNTLFLTQQNSNLVSSKREFQIKDFVQAMVEGRLPNNGFRLRKNDETTVLNTTYYTREDATASNRPQLIIQYYLRSYVSAATIVHTSTLSSTDGSISPTVTNGSNTTMTYRWYNASGTQIATTQNLTGVGKGWYGLKYYGTTGGDTTYQAFIVGTECETVSITFDPGPNYIDDARFSDFISGSGTTAINYPQQNNGSNVLMLHERWTNGGTWYNARDVLKFRMWIDPGCNVNSAVVTLVGNAHNPLQTANTSELQRITSDWSEFGVAHTNMPSATATGAIAVPGIAAGNGNATPDIASFFNIWKTNNVANYGMLFQLTSYASNLYTRMQFNSSDATTAANRPQIAFSIKVNTCDLSRKGSSVVTYDATNTYGDVAVTITPPSWAVSPYQYMISEQPIPNFGDIYHTLKDTIFDGVLDSVKFYLGDNNTSLTNSFTSLKQGQYYISTFDKLGARIYDNLVSINPINYETSANISFSNDVFTTSAANGKAIMTDYLTETSGAASITYTVVNNTGESFFGLQNLSSPLAVKTDIYYGFHVQSGSARVINAGVVGGTAYTVTATDEFSIVKDGGNLKFYISGVLKATAALPSTFTYKSGVFAAGSATKIKYKPIHLFPLSWVLNIMNPVVPGSCLGSFGQVSGTFWTLNLGSKVMVNPVTVLKNSSNVVQTMDAGATATAYSYSNLLPGNYTLTLTFNWQVNGVTNPTPIVYTYNIVVGSRITWENKVAVTDVSTPPLLPFPLLATTTNTWGHASSVNTVNTTPTTTFVDFTPNIGGYFYVSSGSWPFINLITIASGTGVLGFGDPTVTPLTTTIPSGFSGYYFSKTLLGPYTVCRIVNGVAAGGVLTFNAGDKFRIVYTPGGSPNTSLYKYTSANVLGSAIPGFSFNYSAGIKNLIGYVKTKNNTGFINLSTNMACPVNTIYAKLERELKGVKYPVNLNKFYFFYDEEYASTTSLKYNVYDKNNAIVLSTAGQVLTQTIANQPNREYGDNRYYLDVTSLGSGSYILEVINEKDEKFYLRFIK